jgi:hypothetical protein
MLLRSTLLLIAFGVCTIVQAQQFDALGGAYSEADKRYRIYEANLNKQRYPYDRFTEGLAMYKSNAGVQKCLRWVTYAPPEHRQRNPYIEKALYDIGRYGKVYLYSQGKIHSNDKFLEVKAYKALDFCNQDIPVFPSSLMPANRNEDGSARTVHSGFHSGPAFR